VTFAPGAGSVSASPVVTGGNGQATATWTLGTTGGTQTLTVSSGTLHGSPVTFTANASPGSAAQLTVTTQPSSSARSGVAFAQQPAVQLRDANGNAVSQQGVVVTAAIASGGGTLGGTLTASTNSAGVATFTDLSIAGTVGARTLSFSASGLAGVTSTTVTVTAGVASQLALTTQPSASVRSGLVFAQQPVLQVRDASGNPVDTTGIVVTAALASGNPTLGGTLTATVTSGVATFTNLMITGTTGARTLSFTGGTLSPVTSTTVTVTAGVADTLRAVSSLAVAGTAGQVASPAPVVMVVDASGNPVSGTSVTFTPDAGSVSPPSPVLTGANGQATVTWTLGTTAGSQTLTVSSGTLHGSPVTFTATASAGLAAKYIVTVSSANPAPGANVTVTAQLADASDNPVGTLGLVITWSSTGAGGSFSSPTSTTDAGGAATVTFTVSTTPTTVHTVTATDGGGLTGTSGNITVAGPTE
jgi:hypothetical protein